MTQATQASVPWTNANKLFRPQQPLPPDSAGGRARACCDFTQHQRYTVSANRHPFSWREGDGMVHMTEAMVNPHWGVDRVTLCRKVRLNEEPQQSCETLDIVPCELGVNCMLCLVVLW